MRYFPQHVLFCTSTVHDQSGDICIQGRYLSSLYLSFAWRRWIFENHNSNALNLSHKNVITAGRLKCCGMEDRTVVAHGCRKSK